MNRKLQAGVELVLEKMAAEEHKCSLSGVLSQKYAEMESNIVKEDKGTSNGNSEAGKNDQEEEPTIEGGDCIKGLTISSDYGNAKTAAKASPLLEVVRMALGKSAADPTSSLGTRAGDPTQTDELEPAKSIDKNPTAGGGAGASKANQNPLISGDSGGLNTPTGPKDSDSTKPHSQKMAGYKEAYVNRDTGVTDNSQSAHNGANAYPKLEGNAKEGEIPREVLPKTAGWKTELAGSNLNPLNMVGSPIGMLVAALTKTKSLGEVAEADKDTWSNILVPGKASYNLMKRLGSGIRGPEMKDTRRDLYQDEVSSLEQELAALEGGEKEAGWKTEAAGSLLNPLNLLGGSTLGTIAAALTKTKSLKDVAKSDEDTWSNILIPGKATYNAAKRIGSMIRGPEMHKTKGESEEDNATGAKKVKMLKARIKQLKKQQGRGPVPGDEAFNPKLKEHYDKLHGKTASEQMTGTLQKYLAKHS
jgi:hypothetical protein